MDSGSLSDLDQLLNSFKNEQSNQLSPKRLKDLIISGKLEVLMNNQANGFVWKLEISESFKSDDSLEKPFDAYELTTMIIDLMKGSFNQKKLHKKSYFKLIIELRNSFKIFSIAGYIRKEINQRFYPYIIIAGIFHDITSYRNIKENIKRSGIMFLKQTKKQDLFMNGTYIQPIFCHTEMISLQSNKKLNLNLFETIQLLIKNQKQILNDYWIEEGLNIETPKSFLLNFLKLLSKENPQRKSANRILTEMNPFIKFGINVRISCQKELYRDCRLLKKFKLFKLFDDFCKVLSGKGIVNKDFILVEKAEFVNLITLNYQPFQVQLCVYLKHDSIRNADAGFFRNSFSYKLDFITEYNSNGLLEIAMEENAKILNYNKLIKFGNLKSLILNFETIKFMNLESFSFNSEPVSIFVLSQFLYPKKQKNKIVKAISLIVNSEYKIPFKKLYEFCTDKFSIFELNCFLIPNSNLKIEIVSRDNRTINNPIKYQGPKTLFLSSESFYDLNYKSFKFYLQFIVKIKKLYLAESLMNSNNYDKTVIFENIKKYINENLDLKDQIIMISKILITNYIEPTISPQLNNYYINILNVFAISISDFSYSELFEELLEIFAKSYIKVSQIRNPNFLYQLSEIKQKFQDNKILERFAFNIAKVVSKYPKFEYNENFLFIDEMVKSNNINSKEILDLVIDRSKDIYSVFKALLNIKMNNYQKKNTFLGKITNEKRVKLKDFHGFFMILNDDLISDAINENTNDFVKIIIASIRENVYNNKIVDIQELMNAQYIMFLNNRIKFKKLLQDNYLKLIFNCIFECHHEKLFFHIFFEVTLSKCNLPSSNLNEILLCYLLKIWIDYFHDNKILFITTTIDKLKDHWTFFHLSKVISRELVGNGKIDTLGNSLKIIFDRNNYLYLIDNFFSIIKQNLTISKDCREDYKVFKTFDSKIQKSEIGNYILNEISSKLQNITDQELESEFQEDREINDLIRAIVAYYPYKPNQKSFDQISEEDKNFFSVQLKINNYICAFFNSIIFGDIKVKIIKNISQINGYRSKIKLYFELFINNKYFQENKIHPNFLENLCQEYTLTYSRLEKLKDLLIFLQDYSNEEMLKIYLNQIQALLKINISYKNFKIPKELNTFHETANIFSIINFSNCLKSKLQDQIISIQNKKIKESLDPITKFCDYIIKNCKNLSGIKPDSYIHEIFNFFEFFPELNELKTIMKNLNLILHESLEELIQNFKIKLYVYKACSSILTLDKLLLIENDLKIKLESFLNNSSIITAVSVGKYNELFKIQNYLTSLNDYQEKKVFYEILISLAENIEMIEFLLKEEILKERNIFEELISIVDQRNIMKDPKYSKDSTANYFGFYLTVEIVQDFKMIRNIIIEIVFHYKSFHNFRIVCEQNMEKYKNLPALINKTEKFYSEFEDLIARHYKRDSHIKKQISSICEFSEVRFEMNLDKYLIIIKALSIISINELIEFKEKALLEKRFMMNKIDSKPYRTYTEFISFVEILQEIDKNFRCCFNLGVSFMGFIHKIQYKDYNLSNFTLFNEQLMNFLTKIEDEIDKKLKENYSFTLITPNNYHLVENYLLCNRIELIDQKIESLTTLINSEFKQDALFLKDIKKMAESQISINESIEKKFRNNSTSIKKYFQYELKRFVSKIIHIKSFTEVIYKNSKIIEIFKEKNYEYTECLTEEAELALICIYINYCRSLPPLNNFINCKSTTSFDELKFFLYRMIKSEKSQLFALVQPENLNFEIQKTFIEFFPEIHNKHEIIRKGFCVITTKKNNIISEFLNSQFQTVQKFNLERNLTHLSIHYNLLGLKNIKCFYSDSPGSGKTSYIKTLYQEYKYVEVKISGEFNQNSLENLFDFELFNEVCHYHLILSLVQDNKFLNEFLYYFIYLKCIFFGNFIFTLNKESIISIEIEDIFDQKLLVTVFPVCKNLNKTQINFVKDSKNITLNHKIQNVIKFKYRMNTYKSPSSNLDYIQETIFHNLFNQILNNEENLKNYYQINQFFSILDSIFICFEKSDINTGKYDEIIQHLDKNKAFEISQYLKDQFEIIVDAIFKSIKNFSSKIEKLKTDEEEDPEICKSWKEIFNLFIYFNSKGKMFVITNNIEKNYPAEFKPIKTIQNAFNDEIQEKNGNKLLYFFKYLFGSYVKNLRKKIKNEDFDYPIITEDHDCLITNLLEIVDKSELEIKEMKENIKKIENYVLTLDNFVKMVLIYIRFRSNVPIIIMGESGCGKTSLLKFFVENILNDHLESFSINAGTDLKMIKDYLESVKNLSEKIKKENPFRHLWVFFDEFNTSPYVSYFSQILVEKTFRSEVLPDNIIWVGACNPCRFVKNISNIDEDEYSLPKRNPKENLIKQKQLLHQVKKLPSKVIEHIWDFGNLEVEHLKSYISKMIGKLKIIEISEIRQILIDMIIKAHNYFISQEGTSSVSLRDVSRFIDLSNWFYNFRSNFQKSTGRNIYDTISLKSCILAFMHCYYLRISSEERRLNFLKQNFHPAIVYDQFLETFDYAKKSLMNEMELEEGIVKNKAFIENIYALIPCICNKIPVFICGKPGSTKSLAARYLFSHMIGKNSKSTFFQKLPELFQIYYQGSHSSTSEEVENIFQNAERADKRYKNSKNNMIPVIVFDEIGLAELSPHNPLKVIHKYLEHENKKFGFIGISNWRMDKSKMNRTLYINRIVPDQEELKEISRLMCDSFNISVKDQKDIIEKSAIVYFSLIKSYRNHEIFKNFYGLRDFYNAVKFICKSFKGSNYFNNVEIIINAFSYNFGGITGIYNQILENLADFFSKDYDFKRKKVPKSIDLLKERLISNDQSFMHSRYILAFSDTELALFLLKNYFGLEEKSLTIVFGSHFNSDKTSEESLKSKLSDILNYISKETILVLIDLENAYPSLYDLFNQNFTSLENGQKYCKVTIGTQCNYRTFVNNKLKIIILTKYSNENIKTMDPPFLNRFEKYRLDLDEIMTPKQVSNFSYLQNWVENICLNGKKKIKISPEIIFPLLNDSNLKFMALQNEFSILVHDSNFEKCSIKMMLRNSSADLEYLIGNSEEEKKYRNILEEMHGSTFYEDLNKMISDEIMRKFLALTYDYEGIKVDQIKTKVTLRKLTHYKNEREMKIDMENFLNQSENSLLALELKYSESSQFLFQIISTIDCLLNEKEYKNKFFVVLLRLSRNDSSRPKLIYEPLWKSKMYDKLHICRKDYINTSLSYSQELILADKNNKYIEENLIHLIKKSFMNINFKGSTNNFNFEKHRDLIVQKFSENPELRNYFINKIIFILQIKLQNKNNSKNLIIELLFNDSSIISKSRSTYHAIEIIKSRELLESVSLLVLNLEFFSSFSSYVRYFNEEICNIFDDIFNNFIFESPFNSHPFENKFFVIEQLEFPFIKLLYQRFMEFNRNYYKRKEIDDCEEIKNGLKKEFYSFLYNFDIRKYSEIIVTDLLSIIFYEADLVFSKDYFLSLIVDYLASINDIIQTLKIIDENRSIIFMIQKLSNFINYKKSDITQVIESIKIKEVSESKSKFQNSNNWFDLIEFIISIAISEIINDDSLLFNKLNLEFFTIIESIAEKGKINEMHAQNLLFIYELSMHKNVKIYISKQLKDITSYNIISDMNQLRQIINNFSNLKNARERLPKFINKEKVFYNHNDLKIVLFCYLRQIKSDPQSIQEVAALYKFDEIHKIKYSHEIIEIILSETGLYSIFSKSDFIIDFETCFKNLNEKEINAIQFTENSLCEYKEFKKCFSLKLFELINSQDQEKLVQRDDLLKESLIFYLDLIRNRQTQFPLIIKMISIVKIKNIVNLYIKFAESEILTEKMDSFLLKIENILCFDIFAKNFFWFLLKIIIDKGEIALKNIISRPSMIILKELLEYLKSVEKDSRSLSIYSETEFNNDISELINYFERNNYLYSKNSQIPKFYSIDQSFISVDCLDSKLKILKSHVQFPYNEFINYALIVLYYIGSRNFKFFDSFNIKSIYSGHIDRGFRLKRFEKNVIFILISILNLLVKCIRDKDFPIEKLVIQVPNIISEISIDYISPNLLMFLFGELIKYINLRKTMQEACEIFILNESNQANLNFKFEKYKTNIIKSTIEKYLMDKNQKSFNREKKSNQIEISEGLKELDLDSQEFDILYLDFNLNSQIIMSSLQQATKQKYPCCFIYSNYKSELLILSHFNKIINFTNLLIEKFSFRLTRNEARRKKFIDITINSTGFLKNIETSYTEFIESLEIIQKLFNQIKRLDLIKPNIDLSKYSEHSSLENFLIHEEDSGDHSSLTFILKSISKIHNEIASLIIDIKQSKERNNLKDNIFKIQKLYSGQSGLVSLLSNIDEEKFLLKHPSEWKIEFFYDLESFEKSLSYLLRIDKKVDISNIESIQYYDEIFQGSKYKELIEELREKFYSIELSKIDLDNLNKVLKNLKEKEELLKLVFRIMVFLNQINNTNNKNLSIEEILIKNKEIEGTIPYFLKNIKAIISLKCSHIVIIFEIIEIECFDQYVRNLDNEFKVQMTKKEYLELFYTKLKEKEHPCKSEILFALIRVIMRYANSSVESSNPVHYFMKDKSIWNQSYQSYQKAEKMIEDCWPPELMIRELYDFYRKYKIV